MKVISCSGNTVPEAELLHTQNAVALGFFDGVHVGHASLVKEAARSGFVPVVYTFEKHPAAVLCPEENTEYITDNKAKTEIFSSLGARYTAFDEFSDVRDMTPEQFVDFVLRKKLNCAYAVCGENYRFGKNGAGNSTLLEELLSSRGIACTVVPPVLCGTETVSSTRIRELIKDGRAGEAAELLGRPYSFSSEVISGKRLGRTIGVPTVNQRIPKGAVIPKSGVYAVLCDTESGVYRGVCDIGVKPTVGGTELLAETHIIGFTGDLYGKTVKISLCDYLRGEEKFPSLEELGKVIAEDVKKTEKYFEDSAK